MNAGSVSFDDVVARAKALAAEKRASGEIPEGTSSALDRLFLEVAPPGARAEADGLRSIVDVLARYTFDPVIPVDTHRRKLGWLVRLVKRLVRPFAAFATRHLAHQLNAYHGAEIELLRAIVQEVQSNNPNPKG